MTTVSNLDGGVVVTEGVILEGPVFDTGGSNLEGKGGLLGITLVGGLELDFREMEGDLGDS